MIWSKGIETYISKRKEKEEVVSNTEAVRWSRTEDPNTKGIRYDCCWDGWE